MAQKRHFREKTLKAFISLDNTLGTLDILNHYVYRWPIETFFRESKRYLALNDYQVRSESAINKYFVLLMLTYTYCELEVSGDSLNLSKGIKSAHKEVQQSKIAWIHEQSKAGVPLQQIFQVLKIA